MNGNRMRLETDIIAAILYDSKDFFAAKQALVPEYFEYPLWRKVMESVHKCGEAGKEIAPVNIYTVGKLSEKEVGELVEIGAHRADLKLLAKMLAEENVKEKLGVELKARLSVDRDPFEMLDAVREAEQEAVRLISANVAKDKTVLLDEYLTYILTNSRDGVKRIPTPFPTLNRMLSGGLSLGDISFIGGLPGSGKTSFMLSLALYAAQHGTRTAFIEAEMPSNEVFERLNGIYTGETIDRIREGKEYEQLTRDFVSKVFSLPLEIVPCYERTMDVLIGKVLHAAASGSRLIFVDYLQVFTPKGKAEDEYSQIKRLSETLRQLALQHGIHLCIASSLNRNEVGQRTLSLASLYGSSQLGHDCALAMLLRGEEKDTQELVTRKRNIVLHVVKNRAGARGEINLTFHLSSQRMEEVAFTPQNSAVGFSDNGGENAF